MVMVVLVGGGWWVVGGPTAMKNKLTLQGGLSRFIIMNERLPDMCVCSPGKHRAHLTHVLNQMNDVPPMLPHLKMDRGKHERTWHLSCKCAWAACGNIWWPDTPFIWCVPQYRTRE
jgi:hypothetical protein